MRPAGNDGIIIGKKDRSRREPGRREKILNTYKKEKRSVGSGIGKGSRLLAAALVLGLLLGLSGCGETLDTGFRVLEVIGVRSYSVICRKDDKIAPLIDEAMGHLAYTGHLGSLCIRWLGRDLITLAGSPPAVQTTERQETEEEQAQSRRTLIVGIEKDFYPMAFTEDGELRGLSVDLASALGSELTWEVSYQPITPAEVGTQLSSGNIDCALGFDPACVKEDAYTVGVSYLDSDIVLAVRQESEVTRAREIRGERIGTVDDPSVTKAVKESETITKYASGASRRCVSAMDNGWCAAVAMDVIMLEYANH